jgi:hypothetical protein
VVKEVDAKVRADGLLAFGGGEPTNEKGGEMSERDTREMR